MNRIIPSSEFMVNSVLMAGNSILPLLLNALKTYSFLRLKWELALITCLILANFAEIKVLLFFRYVSLFLVCKQSGSQSKTILYRCVALAGIEVLFATIWFISIQSDWDWWKNRELTISMQRNRAREKERKREKQGNSNRN